MIVSLLCDIEPSLTYYLPTSPANTRITIANDDGAPPTLPPEEKEVTSNGVDDAVSIGSAHEEEQLEENMV